MKTPAVRRRSRWERLVARVARPRAVRQRVFGFVERAERFVRNLKMVIAGLTILSVVVLLAALPSGRYLAGWLAGRARRAAMYLAGRELSREEIDADWRRRRQFDMESARDKHR